jgi:MoaA/NifB/PqqE/SkfB family radical SAM enzyme
LWKDLRWVNLTGGEPFLRSDITNVVEELLKLPKLEGIAIPTNGFLTDLTVKHVKEMLKVIPEDKFLSITVSIDGYEKTHDKIRGVSGAYRKALKTLEKLKEIKNPNFNVGVQPTISKANIGEIEKFYKFMKKNTESVGFAVALTSEGYYDNKDSDVALNEDDKKRIAKFFRKIIKNDPQYGFYYSKLIDMFEGDDRGFGCMAGYTTVYMDPKGMMSPCPVLSSLNEYHFGSASEPDSWKSSKARRIRKSLKTEEICRSCTMMCDFIAFAKVEFIEHAGFMMMHPAILYRLMKKIGSSKNPYF